MQPTNSENVMLSLPNIQTLNMQRQSVGPNQLLQFETLRVPISEVATEKCNESRGVTFTVKTK